MSSAPLYIALLILQPFRNFTYVTAHSPTLPSLYLRHNSFSNHSVASPASQIILKPFFRFSNVTGFSLISPGEPLMQIPTGHRPMSVGNTLWNRTLDRYGRLASLISSSAECQGLRQRNKIERKGPHRESNSGLRV